MSTSTSSRPTTQKGKTSCLFITSLMLRFYHCISSGVSVASCCGVLRGLKQEVSFGAEVKICDALHKSELCQRDTVSMLLLPI